jgi:hypothetical protein
MELARKLTVAFMVALLSLAGVACSAEGGVDEDGAGVQVEGEGEGGEGEGGDD